MTKNMNDRYLYRAKRTDNGEWIIGILIIFEGIAYIMEDENTYIRAYYDGGDCVDFDMRAYKIKPSTICKCTGLKDKNGKLIWENDICDRKNEYPEIVKYHDGDWTLDYSYASNNESGFNYCNLGFYVTERNCVEVIGNIFDDTELLEVGECQVAVELTKPKSRIIREGKYYCCNCGRFAKTSGHCSYCGQNLY